MLSKGSNQWSEVVLVRWWYLRDGGTWEVVLGVKGLIINCTADVVIGYICFNIALSNSNLFRSFCLTRSSIYRK